MMANKPHALIVPAPAQGHINPLMHLSKLLSNSGFHVSFVHSEYNLQRILTQHQNCNIPLPRDLGFDIELLSISDGLPLHSRLEGFNAFSEEEIACRQRSSLASFERLLEEMTSPSAQSPLTCVIADYFAVFAHSISKKFGVPELIFWPQSAAVFAIYSETQRMISKGLICPVKGIVREKETADYLNCSIPGLPTLQASSLPYMDTERWHRYIFGIIQESNKYISEVPLILCNSFFELETETMESVVKNYHLCAVGPLLPSPFPNDYRGFEYRSGANLWKEEACLEWLDTQAADTVLYVSVGSIIVVPKPQLHEIAHGLKASKQPFLWVIRGHEGEQMLKQALPEGFLEDTKEQGRVVAWAPQLWVLAHAAVGGFLTHCGWNSTLESISMGVPMITWSWVVDQRVNTRLVVDKWKVGEELKEIGRAQVERSVRRLMQEAVGQEMRLQARKLQQAARTNSHSHKHLLVLFNYIRDLAATSATP